MLFPEKMCEVSVVVHKRYTEELLSELHETGWLQIFDCESSSFAEDKKFQSTEPQLKRVEALSEHIIQSTRIYDILKKSEEKPKGFYQAVKNYKPPQKNEVARKPVANLLKEARSSLKEQEFIIDQDSERSNNRTKVNNLKLQQEKVRLFEKMNIDLDLFNSTRTIEIKLGRTTMPSELTAELREALLESGTGSKQYAIYFQVAPSDLEGFIAVVIIPHDALVKVRKVFAGRHFAELELSGTTGTPKAVLDKLRYEIDELERKNKEIDKSIEFAYREHFSRVSALHEELEIARRAASVISKFGETVSTQIICGWCKERNLNELKSLCERVTSGNAFLKVRVAEQEPTEDAPVELNNPSWAKPFEMLTTTFAHPKYSEIDPTVVIAPLFVLFFGIMLGDAGYGMLILALSIFGYTKLGKASRTLKNFSHVGLWIGTVTIIMGILMGSFFGDLIPRFFYNDPEALLYNITVAGIALPYDSFRNPMLLFQISLMIGLVIINLGIILGAMLSVRRKNYKDLVSKQLSWFVIQPPAIILIGQTLLKMWEFSGGVMIISAITLLIGLVMLSMQYTISYKALTMFDITGFLGDWLSFVRLLALALATIGMALTFNIMGELILNVGESPVAFAISLVVASIFMIVAHLINLGLQTLGASIHSLRLQYIELFNRCYEGGGTPFSPFSAGRVHTKIKRSNK